MVVISIYVIVITTDIYIWVQNRKTTDLLIKRRRISSSVSFTVFIVALSLAVYSAMLHINFFEYAEPIEHAKSSEISLQDFKGLKVPGQSLDGVKEFGFIVTSIDLEKGNNSIILKALFHPSRSYIYNENLADKFLLSHEIYHFHITEYCARLARREISNTNDMPSSTELEKILQEHKELENQLQKQYDNESYHSYILKKQKEWEVKIDSLLLTVSSFKDTKIFFK